MRKSVYSPLTKKLSEILKRERVAAGLTQVEMAKATDRTQAYISKIEAGQLRVDVEDFLRFCEVTGSDVHQLLDELNEVLTR